MLYPIELWSLSGQNLPLRAQKNPRFRAGRCRRLNCPGGCPVWGLYQMFETNIFGTDSQFISAAWLAASGVIIHTAARIADWLLADQA
jgi:hypothetical protein